MTGGVTLGDKAAAMDVLASMKLSRMALRLAAKILFRVHSTRSPSAEFDGNYDRMAAELAVDRRNAIRAMQELEAVGLFERHKGGGRSKRTTFTLTLERVSNPPLFKGENSVKPATVSEPETVATFAQNSDDFRHDTLLDRGSYSRGETRPAERSFVDDAFKSFCVLAVEHSLPVPKALTAQRRRALQARLKEHGADAWQQALDQIAGVPFLRGGGDRGWRVDLDWLLAPGNFVKVIEGKYSDTPRRNGAGDAAPGTVAAGLNAFLAEGDHE